MIEFQNTSKTYRSLLGRSVHAVEDFSLQVAEGEVLGIAGPNGAGKSTLIALLLGYIQPTSGRVVIDNVAPRTYVETNGVGYVSEVVNIPPRWRADNALKRYAILAGVPQAEVHARVEEVIERVGLAEHREKKIKALSKGNAQRVGLAQALLRDEKVFVFDEPTHGLDPVWTQRFRDIVQSLRRPDRIIIIASHNLDELQRLADRVAIIDHGQLQRLVSTGYEPSTEGVMTYRLRIVAGMEHVANVFGGAVDAGKGEFDIAVQDIPQLNRGMAELIKRGVLIASMTPTRSVLEEQFLAAVGSASTGERE